MNKNVNQLDVVITYLEMTTPPTSAPPPKPLKNIALLKAEAPTLSFYRFLYGNVGAPWLWYERRIMSDEALNEAINNDGVDVFVLYLGGVPAGYFELNFNDLENLELAYFGLMPEFVGLKLGPYLLRQAIDTAWTHDPGRVWVNTCTLDHPAALGVYQRAGFTPFNQEKIVIDDPREAYPHLDWPEPPK